MAALFSVCHDMSLRFWVASDGISYRRGLCSLFVRRYRANARASKVERQRKVHAFLCPIAIDAIEIKAIESSSNG